MRSVSWRIRAVAVALVVVLLVPAAAASDAPAGADPSLWEEFLAWLAIRIDIPNGDQAPDVEFTVWLMIRIGIPNG